MVPHLRTRSASVAARGVFRDQADFAVLVLFRKDDSFGHLGFWYTWPVAIFRASAWISISIGSAIFRWPASSQPFFFPTELREFARSSGKSPSP